MKKLLLSFLTTCISIISIAQCTPGANFSDSLFGAWPDTTENLPGAAVNVPYSTTLNFKVPLNASDVNPLLTGTIQNFVVNNVTGLPAGLSYACNNSSCTFNGGSIGCAQISGTPTILGTYPVTIEVTGNINIGFGVIIPAPYTFSGYRIVVGTAGITDVSVTDLTVSPNPVQDKLTVNGLKSADNVAIYAIDGSLLLSLDGSEKTSLDLDCRGLKTGVYLLKCTSDNTTKSIRFLKD
jgi:hypothetical protein